MALAEPSHGAVLLDTQALIWWDGGGEKLGRRSRRMINGAVARGTLMVSSVSFWETARLVAAGKIMLRENVECWREELLGGGLNEVPLDGGIAVRALALSEFHSDPFDLFIAASAMARRARLITSDRVVLGWEMKHLAAQNALE